MDSHKRKPLLVESLKTATALADLYSSEAFQDSLAPHLEKLSTVQYIDPSLFKTKEEYDLALNAANLKAGAYSELLTFLKGQRSRQERIIQEVKKLNEQEKDEKTGVA